LVRYSEGASIPQLAALREKLRGQPLIDDVRVDLEWVQRLHGMLEVARKVAVSLGLALSLGVLLIIGNTIRLSIESRREEIIVVKLVGGTDSYVRRPFLYTGLWYGLMGGLLAWLMVACGLFWLDDTVDRLARLYQSGFSLKGLGFEGLLSLLMIGVTLGLLGASIAVSKHLAALEPR
jgi:cell division transport system permease protein